MIVASSAASNLPERSWPLAYGGVFELRKLRRGGEWLLLKGPARQPSRQSLAAEFRISQEWQARLERWEPRVRLPRVRTYDVAADQLCREWIDGRPWRIGRFTTRAGRRRQQRQWQALGRWLGGLHRLSRNGIADPWAALLADWEKPSAGKILQQVGLDSVQASILRRLACRRRRQPMDWPLCRLHGDFSPVQVLETRRNLVVLDLASSRLGMDFEDLAHWCAYFDTLAPWRRWRLEWPAFFRGYYPDGSEWNGSGKWMREFLGWARLRAMVRWWGRRLQAGGTLHFAAERLIWASSQRRFLRLYARLLPHLPPVQPTLPQAG